GGVNGAMLASWVAQASFEPLGFTVAVAKDRAIESLMQVGDAFVLNILEEGNYQPLMKHFLKRFPPGADRFAGIKTQTAINGSPILVDSLAYLECEVMTRMECSDHWVVYAEVKQGKVSNPEALTAAHHRKVGNHY
ncbi:MAG: flavin reductase family protein, partial [Prochlorothrix sp.]